MKTFIIIVVVILLLGSGYFLITQRLSKLSSSTAVEEKVPDEQLTTQPSPKTSFDTNDNLDEALQNLDQLDQF